MTIIVEDGSIVSGAESYCTVATADTYHSNRGVAAWAALTTAQKEEALRRATDYMTQVYRDKWEGNRVIYSQALDWPRVGVVVYYGPHLWREVDDDTVPLEVAYACAELALKASSATLYADQTQGVVREKIGPLETEYDRSSPIAVRYKAVDGILRPYLMQTNGIGVRV